ncbi:MAG: hypothetical protein L7S44_02105 [Flavobacteriaceae bacterium]|nr:hypothetical protein [Flavobacteriaceae bacterium]
MNRELVKHDKFLSSEIRNLKAHIKRINDHLKVGEKLYKKHKHEIPKKIILEHKQKVNNFRKQRNLYMNRLNELVNLRLNFNNMVRELQPSTSGRK